jgi:hypothetical protein
MSSSYFTNESLKSGWEYFHNEFVGDKYVNSDVIVFDKVLIDTIKTFLEISPATYDFHKLIITKKENNDKNKLWIYRNLLFYKILQEIIITLLPEIEDLCKYKISNFGSTNVTSDIDACIQYDGDGINKVSTVIKAIEDYYVTNVGIPCLRLDIEFYDSYISKCKNPIAACGVPCDGVESYTVDFSDSVFNEEAFKQMLPYAFASMIRNVFIAVAEHSPCYQGRCNEQINPSEKIVSVSDKNKQRWTELFKQISDIDSGPSFEKLQKIVVELTDIVILIGLIKEFCEVCLPEEYKNYTAEYETAATLVTEYFNTNHLFDYNEQRKLYYERLKKAEDLISGSDNTKKITAFSESQIFRQEGYVCVSTVIHVPRYIQQCKIKKDSICDTTNCDNDKETKPFCLLNDYAYKLSMIEQIGFMLRFAVSNIINNNFPDTNIENNNTYFNNKITKYKERWTDAKDKIKVKGGKRKHRNTRKTRKSKKSQKNRKRSRKNKRINI